MRNDELITGVPTQSDLVAARIESLIHAAYSSWEKRAELASLRSIEKRFDVGEDRAAAGIADREVRRVALAHPDRVAAGVERGVEDDGAAEDGDLLIGLRRSEQVEAVPSSSLRSKNRKMVFNFSLAVGASFMLPRSFPNITESPTGALLCDTICLRAADDSLGVPRQDLPDILS